MQLKHCLMENVMCELIVCLFICLFKFLFLLGMYHCIPVHRSCVQSFRFTWLGVEGLLVLLFSVFLLQITAGTIHPQGIKQFLILIMNKLESNDIKCRYMHLDFIFQSCQSRNFRKFIVAWRSNCLISYCMTPCMGSKDSYNIPWCIIPNLSDPYLISQG